MVGASLLALGLAPLACPFQEGGEAIELLSTSAEDPASEVLQVFADAAWEGEPVADEVLYVLSRRGSLGAFRILGEEALPVPAPRMPADLGEGRDWVISAGSLGSQGPAGDFTLYRQFFPSTLEVQRPGRWRVLASADGTTLFFLRGGTEVREPAELAAVGIDGVERSTETLLTAEPPRIQASASGDAFLLQTSTAVEAFGFSLDREILPPGRVHLDPAARWIVQEEEHGLALLPRIGDPLPVALPPPLTAVVFEGDYVLLVAPTRAELHDLGAADPSAPVFVVDAIADHRFTSAALRSRPEGPPLVALGELAVIVPQLVLPDAPEPRASVVARAFAEQGNHFTLRERWAFEVNAWRAQTPFVQWSKQGRLLVSTKTRALAGARTHL